MTPSDCGAVPYLDVVTPGAPFPFCGKSVKVGVCDRGRLPDSILVADVDRVTDGNGSHLCIHAWSIA